MASALLRTSVRGGRTVGRFVSAARPGGDALAARPVSLRRYPLRRLSNSTPGDQLPEGLSPDEKVNTLVEGICANGVNSWPNDVVVKIFASSTLARFECCDKQVSRSWSTCTALISGGFVGYYISKSRNGKDGAVQAAEN